MRKRGKSILIFGLFLISISVIVFSYLAGSSTSNVIFSDPDSFIIKDGDRDLVTVEKLYNTDYCLTECYTIWNVTIYNNEDIFLDLIEFKDIRGEARDLEYKFEYVSDYKSIEINDYEAICSGEGNNTVCTQKKIGSHVVYEPVWSGFDPVRKLPIRNYIIKLTGYKERSEDIDWIATFYGQKIDEWDCWKGDEPIGYWKMNEASDGSYYNATDSSIYGQVGNNTGGIVYSEGKLGNSANFSDVSTRYFNFGNSALYDLRGTWTIAVWFKSNETDKDYFISKGQSGGDAGDWDMYFASSGLGFPVWKGYEDNLGDGCVIYNDSTYYIDNNWHRVVVTRDSAGLNMYIDNVLIATDSCSAAYNFTNTGNLRIGTDEGVAYHYKGLIDDIQIWNITWSADDVNTDWNNGIGREADEILDTTPPETSTPETTPAEPKTNDALECYANLTDNMQTNLIAYWVWYKNDVSYLSGNTSVTNGIYNLITTLSSDNTEKGQNWICEVTPYDGYNYGEAKNSSTVTILNTDPNHTNPLLETPTGKNFSYENLTCYNQSTYDADNDNITNIYNWYKNSQPFAVLNMPFESSVEDYSGYNNDRTIYGTTFEASKTEGKVGNALSFDGVDDYVDAGNSVSLQMATKFTIEAWLKWQGDANKNYYAISKGKIGWSVPYNGYQIRYNKYSDSEGYWIFDVADNDTQDSISWRQDPSIANNIWYHIIATFDNGEMKLYGDNILRNNKISTVTNVNATNQNLRIGMYSYSASSLYAFNGITDEVKIYPYVLTEEQIKAHYNLEYNKIVSEETSAGDNWMCQVTPNDAEADGETLNSSTAEIYWAITFNVTSGEDGSQLNNSNIECNNSFSITGANSSEEFGFEPGSYECVFSKSTFFSKTKIFVADTDKIIDVPLSKIGALTIEEHTWLEAIYNCVVLGDCSLYNLLLEMNQTVGNIWEHTKPTDESVIVFENITNKIVNATSNLTIDYTLNIPIKAGYVSGTYLPVRIGYWFLDENNETCYNQGDKPAGVEDPYCQPLVIETIGPMGGSVNFSVKLQPNLAAGDYSIKRIIDIDPNRVWINYGQETIGMLTMAETIGNPGIGLEKTGETMPTTESSSPSSSGSSNSGSSGGTTIIKEKEVTKIVPEEKTEDKESKGEETDGSSGITGGVIGINQISKWQTVIILGFITALLIVFIICQTIIRIKKK